MTKKDLRNHYKSLRSALAANSVEHARRSSAIQQILLASPLWKAAPLIFAYSPVRGEADTALLVQHAWAEGKTVLLPRCQPGKAGCMDMVPCTGPDDLIPAAYGILEPRPELPPASAPWAGQSIVLTPALAFDRDHFRLGYGGGYYDRFFAAHPELVRVGLAFNFQVTEALPREPWDLPLTSICTESCLC